MTRYHLLDAILAVMSIPAFSQTTSLKNNLLYDATLTPNIGIEQKIDSLSTVQLFYGLNPWRLSDTKRLRHWSLMPEYRRWLKEPFLGHFFGIHALGGEFNIAGIGPTASIRDYHYEGWYVGGGLTYGYAWRLAEHWNLEAAIGLGYVHLAYDKYENEECGLLLDSRHKNYVGPTKLALNIAYLIGKKKPVELPPPPVVKEIYQPHYQLAYVTPQAEQEKTRQLSGRAFLDFVVNKTDIRPTYRGNAAELAKVLQTIDVVRRDTFTTITHISIHGYASPESPYQHNAYLAQARAEAFAAYVQGLISLPKNLFTIQSTPEDWEGLSAALMDNGKWITDDVRAIVASDDDPDAKERQLKKMYPREWRWMLDSIFPALRHSDYEVSYTVRPFTVEEAARIIREKPQHLSLNEMFLVANTYEPGSQDYNDVFETAVRMYPNDATANLNAAVIALGKNNLDDAKRYLSKAGTSAEAQNARAVLAIHENRLDDAERLLRQLSLPQAAHNLRELELYRQSIE
ncbi:MAG: DUF3575 domain-containing protein [Prevotella sp.]|nr:DUF3575 domain-containing protein [Prevotella sp.]